VSAEEGGVAVFDQPVDAATSDALARIGRRAAAVAASKAPGWRRGEPMCDLGSHDVGLQEISTQPQVGHA
jgi:hypothetical protein